MGSQEPEHPYKILFFDIIFSIFFSFNFGAIYQKILCEGQLLFSPPTKTTRKFLGL
jgi:hypothetical protein